MKKIAISLAFLISSAINTNSQIPNNGFENWHTSGNCLLPGEWFSTNDYMDTTGSYFGITRSTDHYPTSIGNYSLRIENNTSLLPSLGAYGFAWTGDENGSDTPVFPIPGHPASFCGYYKFIPQNNDTMRIFICLYKNGAEVTTAKLMDTITVSSWTSFIIPIPAYTDADSARIFLSSFNSDGDAGIQGNSVLYVDNLSFDTLITSFNEQASKNKLFSLYPNPANEIITLNINNIKNTDLTLNIYNVIGGLIFSLSNLKNHQQINIGALSSGIYLVEIKAKENSETQKLLIKR